FLFNRELSNVLRTLQQVNSIKEGSESHIPISNGRNEDFMKFLKKLEPCLDEGAPRKCRNILDEMNSISWSPNFASHLRTLSELINRYKFSEAQMRIHSIIKDIHSLEKENG
ncbi:MAG: hypothetical protein OEM02_16875, partial [Desulfobulbaceae bacterium]|nr:hypothetical protein [Desulfobulbaceae bacterium]